VTGCCAADATRRDDSIVPRPGPAPESDAAKCTRGIVEIAFALVKLPVGLRTAFIPHDSPGANCNPTITRCPLQRRWEWLPHTPSETTERTILANIKSQM